MSKGRSKAVAHRLAAIAGMKTRQIQPQITAEELDSPPWEEQQMRAGTGATATEAIRHNDMLCTREPQPIAAGLKPFHEELEKRYERADSRSIGYIPSHNGRGRKAGHKPEARHPWRNPKPGELPVSFEDRFSQLPGRCVQLVKDGRPLTERGAELLMQQKMRLLDQVVCEAARKTWAQPPHSKQTKQVHQYQQTQGRK